VWPDETGSRVNMMAVSSGSTGTPGFWPRGWEDELAIARRFEQVFVDSFDVSNRKTLAVVCFALGTWVGGLFTSQCCRLLSLKGYPVMVVAPGNNPSEIFRVIQALGPDYDQVVLLGYPPFLKEVVDGGLAQGLDWAAFQTKWVMAGEVFSEDWRDLMAARLGSSNPVMDSASLYGTADAGVLGNETPMSISIRRFLAKHPQWAKRFFGSSERLPTLCQYDPRSRYFEVTPEGTLMFSGDNGLPLIRYHIGDEGGVWEYQALLDRLKEEAGFDALSAVPTGVTVRPLPFVYVFGRSHFVISYYGANLYPEQIGLALEQKEVSGWVTGKFVMAVKFDADQNAFWEVVIELAESMKPEQMVSCCSDALMASRIQQHVVQVNSEFAHYVPRDKQLPSVRYLSKGDPVYFPVGVKHRTTRPDLL
jgi:phenylacetate-CoA ligase